MLFVIWEFVAKEGAVERFEGTYGPRGAWARLFSDHPGFRGTVLLRDEDNPRRYVTIDSWETEADLKRMLTRDRARYRDMDEVLADLTESEDEIGNFTTTFAAPVGLLSTARPRTVVGTHGRSPARVRRRR
jgi:heme-degrading monooxygenase HmoA